jgi:hypothetical protein
MKEQIAEKPKSAFQAWCTDFKKLTNVRAQNSVFQPVAKNGEPSAS